MLRCAEEVEPGLPGHDEVGQHEVDRRALERVEGVGDGVNGLRVELLPPEEPDERGCVFDVVVDDETLDAVLVSVPVSGVLVSGVLMDRRA